MAHGWDPKSTSKDLPLPSCRPAAIPHGSLAFQGAGHPPKTPNEGSTGISMKKYCWIFCCLGQHGQVWWPIVLFPVHLESTWSMRPSTPDKRETATETLVRFSTSKEIHQEQFNHTQLSSTPRSSNYQPPVPGSRLTYFNQPQTKAPVKGAGKDCFLSSVTLSAIFPRPPSANSPSSAKVFHHSRAGTPRFARPEKNRWAN